MAFLKPVDKGGIYTSNIRKEMDTHIYTELNSKKGRHVVVYSNFKSPVSVEDEPNMRPEINSPIYTEMSSGMGRNEVVHSNVKSPVSVKDKPNIRQIRPSILLLLIFITAILASGITYLVGFVMITTDNSNKINSSNNCEYFKNECKQSGFRMISSSARCPKGWYTYMSGCYLAIEEKKTWFESQTFCQSQGSDLLSFHGTDESSNITGSYLHLQNKYWIGLQDLDKDNRFEWSDKTALDYTNWIESEPNRWNGVENCVLTTSDGRWNDANCYLPQFFVCKTVITSRCGKGDWLYYNNSCYIFSTQDTTWKEARRNCISNDADLAVIQTQPELDFLLSQAFRTSTTTYKWIGLIRLYGSVSYTWRDGSVANYLPWNRGEPPRNQNPSNDICVCFDTYGNFLTRDCNSIYSSTGYVCEKNL